MRDVDNVNTTTYIDVDSAYILDWRTDTLKRLWQGNRPLTATGLLMLAALAAALIGLAVDSRIITGAPAWLKPAPVAVLR